MGKENKPVKKVNKERQLIIYKSLTIILMLVIIIALGKWGYGKYIEYRSEKLYDELASQAANPGGEDSLHPEDKSQEDNAINETESGEATEQVEETEAEETELPEDAQIPDRDIDWQNLAAINPDIYSWIYIPNTEVDYPILQSQTDDTYYLNHNIDGSKGYPGCIYTEKVNYKDFLDFDTVIYGHNMKSGKMFRTLHNFEDQTFFDNNKYIYIYTEEKMYVYEIFAAYESDDAHILNTNDFSEELGRQAYIDDIMTQADVGGGHKRELDNVTTDAFIITLSTCTSRSDRRYIVQAVRIN